MHSDEETKKKWRRQAYGKLLGGTTMMIEQLIHGVENRYVFERPMVHTSKVLSKKELEYMNKVLAMMKRENMALRKLAWRLQEMAEPGWVKK